jgi:hypothetical protein
MATSSLPPMQAYCHNAESIFFKLPQEIRDMIYEFALTYEDGVNIRFTARTIPRIEVLINTRNNSEHSLEVEANMLMYVCRQMRRETKRLSLRYNNVIIKKSSSSSSLQICEMFLGSVAVSNQRMIKKIEIMDVDTCDYANRTKSEIRALLTSMMCPAIYEFCSRFPSALVIIRFKGYTLLDPTWQNCILSHAAWSMVLRGYLGVQFLHEKWQVLADADPHLQGCLSRSETPDGRYLNNFRIGFSSDFIRRVDAQGSIMWRHWAKEIDKHGG